MSLQQSSQPFSSSPSSTPCNVSNERFMSTVPENYKSLNDAHGEFEEFEDDPPTLVEALVAAKVELDESTKGDLRRKTKKVKALKEISTAMLTDDEIGAIICYTLERTESVYTLINTSASTGRSKKGLELSRKLIFLLLSGLRKLPRFKPSVGKMFYRGLKVKVPTIEEEAKAIGWNQHYTNGQTVTWWGFTSTATNMEVTKNFISKAAQSTLFIIGGADLWGYDIKAFSRYPEETEVLLEPEAKVKVISSLEDTNPLIVNVELQPFTHPVLEDIIPVGGAKHQPPAGLPSGWEARYDPHSGRYYYADTVDKVTTWQQPPCNVALPAGWRVVYNNTK